MKTKFHIWGALFLVFSLALVACREEPLPGAEGELPPAPTAVDEPTVTPQPTGPQAGHWQGETENTHWSLEFDLDPAGQISHFTIRSWDSVNNPCSFDLKDFSLDADGAFSQELAYVDAEKAAGVKGAISGKAGKDAQFSGKLTIKMCGRTIYFDEEDLAWTASWTGQASAPPATTAAPAPTLAFTPTAPPSPTAAPPTGEPAVLIRLGPGRSGQPLWLEVERGEYRLASGATLRAGSAIGVSEDQLVFTPGLAIQISGGEVSLGGVAYPDGHQLIVSASGDLNSGEGAAAPLAEATAGPAQLVVAHNPTQGKFEKASSGQWDYVCKYQTSVTALGTGVTILKFWTSYWEGGRWQDSQEKFTGANFTEWYFCPRAYIAASQTCTDPRNWNATDTLQTVRVKWIFYGVDDNRNPVQGEAMIECRP